jgi:hypothetical protein
MNIQLRFDCFGLQLSAFSSRQIRILMIYIYSLLAFGSFTDTENLKFVSLVSIRRIRCLLNWNQQTRRRHWPMKTCQPSRASPRINAIGKQLNDYICERKQIFHLYCVHNAVSSFVTSMNSNCNVPIVRIGFTRHA